MYISLFYWYPVFVQAELEVDLKTAWKRTHLPHGDSKYGGKYNHSCWPYVAGMRVCGESHEVRGNNSGQYQRGVPEMMYSGYTTKEMVVDELATAAGTGLLQIGTLVGQTFTSHGWVRHSLLMYC